MPSTDAAMLELVRTIAANSQAQHEILRDEMNGQIGQMRLETSRRFGDMADSIKALTVSVTAMTNAVAEARGSHKQTARTWDVILLLAAAVIGGLVEKYAHLGVLH